MKKGFAPILILIAVAVLAAVGAGTWYFTTNSSKTTPPTVTNSATPNSTSDETASWKTYTDQKLKFSIKYPDNIVILRSFPEGGVEFARSEDSDKDFREITTLYIYFRGDKGADPEVIFKEGECPKPCDEKTEEVKINNAIGIRTLGPSYPYEDNYYLTNQNKTAPVVRLSLVPNTVDPNKDVKSFKKILSTFKFTE